MRSSNIGNLFGRPHAFLVIISNLLRAIFRFNMHCFLSSCHAHTSLCFHLSFPSFWSQYFTSCTSTLYIPWRCRPHVILSDKIDVPYKNAVRGSLANRVFGASIAILALAKVHSLASCLSGSLADDPTRMKWSRTNVPWIHVRAPRARCWRRRSEERVRLFFTGSRWHRRT